MKPLTFRPEEWRPLYARIVNDLGIKAPITWVLRRELGFTIRLHRESYYDDAFRTYSSRETVCLDFYDESMRTFFILKYLGNQEPDLDVIV